MPRLAGLVVATAGFGTQGVGKGLNADLTAQVLATIRREPAAEACCGLALKIRAEGVQAITTSAYNAPAPRPANSPLATERLRARFDVVLADWQIGVESWVRTIAEARV